jgi:hypothetical protein
MPVVPALTSALDDAVLAPLQRPVGILEAKHCAVAGLGEEFRGVLA